MSANSGIVGCAPGWFCGVPKPLMNSVSPLTTGVDFISNESPPTHHSFSPLFGAYAVTRNEPGTMIWVAPPGGW
jgi:hypothetical protein